MPKLTGHIGMKEVDGGYRILHVELGFKAYGRSELDALAHFRDALVVHKREIL